MAAAPWESLVVDGVFGARTKRALQTYLKHYVGTYSGIIDGVAGSMTYNAMSLWMRQQGHYSSGALAGKWTKKLMDGLKAFLIKRYVNKAGQTTQNHMLTDLQKWLNAERARLWI